MLSPGVVYYVGIVKKYETFLLSNVLCDLLAPVGAINRNKQRHLLFLLRFVFMVVLQTVFMVYGLKAQQL